MDPTTKDALMKKMRARRQAAAALRGGGSSKMCAAADEKVDRLMSLLRSLNATNTKEAMQLTATIQLMSELQLQAAIEACICEFGLKSRQLLYLHTIVDSRLKKLEVSKTKIGPQKTEPTKPANFTTITDTKGKTRKRFVA